MRQIPASWFLNSSGLIQGLSRKRSPRVASFRPNHLFLLAVLLVAPAAASWKLADGKRWWILVGWYAAVSAFTYFIYADDKQRAQKKEWRAPENALQFFAFAGGWPGAYLAQRRIRHKNAKLRFQLLFWLIVGVHQVVAIDYLLDWRMVRTVMPHG